MIDPKEVLQGIVALESEIERLRAINAELMAALDAIVHCTPFIRYGEIEFDCCGDPFEIAIAAIAKARGE